MKAETFLEAAEYCDSHKEYACWALAIATTPFHYPPSTHECLESEFFMSIFDDGSVCDDDKQAHGLFGSHLSREHQQHRVLALLLAYEIAKEGGL